MNMASAKRFFTNVTFLEGIEFDLKLATREVAATKSRLSSLERAAAAEIALLESKERSASAVCKRIGPALAIVDDESLDGHGLHCVRSDANSGMADAGCGAEQDHALLCGERCCRLCHSYSRRQPFANAAIAASRVAAYPCVGVRSSWYSKASVHIHDCPTGTATALIRPSYRAPSIGWT